MRQREQADHRLAGAPRVTGGEPALPGQAIGRTREQRVAVDEVPQRHGLAAKAVDHVPIVDDVTVPPLAPAAAAPQGEHLALAEEAFQAVIVEADPQPVAD